MSDPTVLCAICGVSKSSHTCAICSNRVCKDCYEYVDTHAFDFFSRIPAKLKLANYCTRCYDAEVVPEKVRYDALMEKAKDVYFMTKAYPGYIRVMRRHTKRLVVEVCDDRRETIMRLAFFAAELGFNAIIESEVENVKVRMDKYQTSKWKGSAMPAIIDGAQLERSSLRRL